MGDLLNLFRVLVGKRFPFQLVYSNEYWMVETGKHVFPLQKYRLVYENLLAMGAKKENFLRPRPAPDEDVLLVHTARYLKRVKTGTLSHAELRALEIRYSPELVRFALLSVGGTVLTARKALECGLAVHLGGGFHHAFPDHGEGFCLLNDVAVAVRKMIEEKFARKVMVVDCDLHQGNGTAAALAGRKDVFTLSIHQMDIYPTEKPLSTVDVGLWAGDGDAKYLAELGAHIPRIYNEFRPDIVFYLAGADPYEKDQLGGLSLTKAGLKERDKVVIENARRLKIPVAVVLAGGYAAEIKDTVDIHLNTVRIAQRVQRVFPEAPVPLAARRPV
ncbi:MAG: histone deacetylase [Acidobacteria bacterium]|nr:histone deacetylase [Acidobacteriota bacterium]MBE3125671.1 histone deacetylase [Acidobacteriota bacterium]